MGNLDFFTELSATNRAHCAAHGFSSAELYGTPPNSEEITVHNLIASGVPSEAAQFRPRKAKHMLFWPRTGIQQLGYIEEHIRQCGCTPRENRGCHQKRWKP